MVNLNPYVAGPGLKVSVTGTVDTWQPLSYADALAQLRSGQVNRIRRNAWRDAHLILGPVERIVSLTNVIYWPQRTPGCRRFVKSARSSVLGDQEHTPVMYMRTGRPGQAAYYEIALEPGSDCACKDCRRMARMDRAERSRFGLPQVPQELESLDYKSRDWRTF